jgi:cytoskeletal protein CcmA (bactofilin family)
MNGNLSIIGNANVNGSLTTVTPDITNNSNLVATTAYVQNQGYAKLEGSQFTGDVSMNNNLQILGNLISVTPSTSENSTLVATTEFVNNKISELVSDPIFTGYTIIDSLIVNLDSSLNGNLHVAGEIYENGNTLINKYATLESPTFTGSVNMPSTVINDKLVTYGDISSNNHLYIGKDASVNENLFVNKRTILNNDVSMNSNLDLSGSIIAHNNVNVYGIINQYTTTLDQGYIVNYSNINASGDLIANGVKLSTNSNGENTFFGMTAGNSITSGINNTFIGYGSGSTITTGSNNIIIGNNSNSSTPTVSNEITIGNSSNSILRCNVQTITSLSDSRDKKNIQKIPLGLEFINDLNPVEFEWNSRDGLKVDEKDFGFIAQELKKSQENFGITVPKLVYEENPDKLEASYGILIPIMVNAIKELKDLTAKQQIEIDELKKKLSA